MLYIYQRLGAFLSSFKKKCEIDIKNFQGSFKLTNHESY
jgi:hypothetical protein